MTTYRKLASSSVAAIERALERRLERLQGFDAASGAGDTFRRAARKGMTTFRKLGQSVRLVPFHADEASEVQAVLKLIRVARLSDAKLQTFLNDVVSPLLAQDQNLLVFTEYRATQSYLAEAIALACPGVQVAAINGSMSLDEKIRNVHVTLQQPRGSRSCYRLKQGAKA